MAAEQAKATIVDADIYVESFGNIEEANMVRKRLCLFICLFFLKLFLVNFPFFSFLTGFNLCARLSKSPSKSSCLRIFTYFVCFFNCFPCY